MKYEIRNINSIKQEEIELIKNKYPKRYLKAMSLASHDDTLRSILAYVILTNLIGEFNESDLCFSDLKKPSIIGKPNFSISHSGELVGVAISENLIGLDIQLISEKNTKLMRAFTLKEQGFIGEIDSSNRFHELWVKKESAMKLIGKGITIPLDKIEVLENRITYENYNINFTLIEDYKNYKIAIAETYEK